LPRGCLDDVCQLFDDLGVAQMVRDERCSGQPLTVAFQGPLRPDQKHAADAMLSHETGVLAATTAFGKTVVAAWLIAQRGVSTLVLVHRRQLLEQWVNRLSTFLTYPSGIGRIGGGRNTPTGQLDVALIQSLIRKGIVDDRVGPTVIWSSTSATVFQPTVSNRSLDARRRDSCSGCRPRSRERTVTIRSFSCSVVPCGIAWTRRHKRRCGRSNTRSLFDRPHL
jgi:hypothetical protein